MLAPASGMLYQSGKGVDAIQVSKLRQGIALLLRSYYSNEEQKPDEATFQSELTLPLYAQCIAMSGAHALLYSQTATTLT